MPPSSSPSVRPARLGAVDALRFVAAVSVLAFHFTGMSAAWANGRAPSAVGALGRWAAYGAMGVPLFFVISGFVVLMTAWGRDVPHFVASRVGRLFPAYWAAVVLACGFAFVLWPAGTLPGGHAATKVEALLNLTMLQGGLGVPDFVGAFWTLWVEARFYLLIAVLVLIGLNRQRVLLFAGLWPLAAVLAAHAGDSLLSTVLISDYAPYFAGGMLLYLIYRDGHDLIAWGLLGVQSLIALNFALGYYPGVLPNSTGWPVSPTVVALISFACFGSVAVATLTRLGRRSARWMTFLGALTYPLYLVHEKVGQYLIHELGDNLSPWAALGIATVAALAVATLLHYAVERPLGGRLRRTVLQALRKTTDRRPSAPAHPGRHHAVMIPRQDPVEDDAPPLMVAAGAD